MPENSAGRNLAELAERITVAWIEGTDPVPTTLADAVKKYRILTKFYDYAENHGIDTAEVSARMNRLYDSLVESAAHYVEHCENQRGVSPDKQLRRLERKAQARMTLTERMNQAIAEWRAAHA